MTAAAVRLLLLLISLSAVRACYQTATSKLDIGDKTWVCITIGGTDSATGMEFTYARFPFQPRMDDFTLLQLENSWTSEVYSSDELFSKVSTPTGVISDTESQLWMHIESEGQYSYQKIFRANLETFPQAVAVISVSKGVVEGISWDTGCFSCAASDCKKNVYSYSAIKDTDYAPDCYTDDSDCSTEKCSLEVYVTWSGTDKNGNYLLSQQKRLSNFQSGQVE